jgi:hypothetical protein
MGSDYGPHVPLPDALIESTDGTAPAARDPANRAPRLVLVPQHNGPGGDPPGVQKVVARPEPILPVAVAFVDAPSALAGFLLVMSLPGHHCRNSQSADGRWRVSVELRGDDSLSALVDVVERWLRRERITATDLRVGEDVRRLTGADPRSGSPPSSRGRR